MGFAMRSAPGVELFNGLITGRWLSANMDFKMVVAVKESLSEVHN